MEMNVALRRGEKCRHSPPTVRLFKDVWGQTCLTEVRKSLHLIWEFDHLLNYWFEIEGSSLIG